MTSSWADRRPVATRVSAAEAVFTDLRQAIESGDLPVVSASRPRPRSASATR